MVSQSSDGPLDDISWYQWENDNNDANWLLTYVDVLSVILAMLVVLLGQMAVRHMQPIEEQNQIASAYTQAEAPVPTIHPKQIEVVEEITPQSQPDNSAVSRLTAAIEQRFDDEVKVVQRELGVSLEIADVILFHSGKAELLPEAQPVLSRLAMTLQEIGEADIAVEGHTDDRPILGGPFQSNWELAAARANAVTRFLLDQGFSPKHLRSVSFADSQPVADNSNADGRAENRRVNLRVDFL
ncbi:MAG: OmpA family protein [Candidatus Thiodiazotropha sp. (ex Ctena orbiculata)]|nr:OmpA family protein [Candidatus Thiodiazotropha taylori]